MAYGSASPYSIARVRSAALIRALRPFRTFWKSFSCGNAQHGASCHVPVDSEQRDFASDAGSEPADATRVRPTHPSRRLGPRKTVGANVDFLPSVRIFLSFLSSLFRAPPRQICEKFLRPVTPCSSFAPFRVRKQGAPMLDQAPCGPAVPCLSRQARAAVMVHLRGEADAGHRSAVINERHVG